MSINLKIKKGENLMKLKKIGTQIQQIRNATIKLSYGGYIFLIDPWLAPKGATGSLLELIKESLR